MEPLCLSLFILRRKQITVINSTNNAMPENMSNSIQNYYTIANNKRCTKKLII